MVKRGPKLEELKMRRQAFGQTQWIVWAIVAIALLPISQAMAEPLLRISLENSPEHVQTRAVQRFADTLAVRTRGQLRVELYANAQLYRDSEVVPALADGKVEMAVPGTWQLDRYEPSVGVLLLPGFYGTDRESIYGYLAGPLGKEIDQRIERSTGSIVLGEWIDLGSIHLFSVDILIEDHTDITGLIIRYAGGLPNEMRLAALGAKPVLIPWPDFPQRLRQGEVDGVLTSFETIASASLWEAGIQYAYEDSEYFGRYVPLVSERFWNRLPAELRLVIRDTWNEFVDQARTEAAEAQLAARETLIQHGITIVVPDIEEINLTRVLLNATEGLIVERLGLDQTIIDLIPKP